MLSDRNNLYWGDAHTNLRPHQSDLFDRSFQAARDVIDFWPVAYYAFCSEEHGGFELETLRQRPLCLEQWKALCSLTSKYNEDGRFICFPGYEWHGDRRRWGDHNVFYCSDESPLDDAETLTELYGHLRERKGIAIPHHTAYQTGCRGKDWSVFDEELSPFVEIFSTHGCSEGYGSPKLMDRNMGAGPMVQAGSVHSGLARGLHFGFTASGDLHAAYPTQWGSGVMACYAQELSREALWKAFLARQVYAVTGDRIKLDFSVSNLPMGSIGRAKPPYTIEAHIEGSDALSRVELLRNNRVIQSRIMSYIHEDFPQGETRYKTRAIFGWGPMAERYPDVPERSWEVALDIENGRLLEVEKMWNRFGQRLESQSPEGCRFRLTTASGRTTLHANPAFQGMGLEVLGTPQTRLRFRINGKPLAFTLKEARTFPFVFAELDTGETVLRENHGITPEFLAQGPYESNIIYSSSYKTQVWPAVHEGEFAATLRWEDTPESQGESWYTIRVIQNNGQAAWSSPIWVAPGTE